VTRAQKRWLLVATILGSSMAFIDGTVVNVALPALQHAFDADMRGVQWVLEGYTLALAAFLLVGGAAGDLYGHRRVFALGAALFALASIGCGLAGSLPVLVIARGIQGIGGALLVPGSLALINESFAPDERGAAIGAWSGWSAITTAGGPVLGGWLVQHASWRWVFFVNVPIAVAVLLILRLALPPAPRRTRTAHLDLAGTALTAVGFGAVVLGLIEHDRGTLFIAVAESIGVVALVALLVVESRVRDPMLPLALFRSRAFSGANLLTLLLYTGLSGVFFFLPLNLIQVQGFTPTQAGAALLPFVLFMSTLSKWAGALVPRVGARLPLVVGTLVSGAGFVLFMLPGAHAGYVRGFLPGIVVLGLGMAVVVAPLTTVVMASVEEAHAGAASGINNAVSRVAGLLAVAVFGVLLSSTFDATLTNALERARVPPAEQLRIAAQHEKLAAIETANAAGREAVERAFVAGFRVALGAAAALALLAAGIASATIPGRKPKA
jgi:EmrB/QacA subfamily drug resistance transporter